MFGLCLSTASTVVLLRALEERQLIDSQRGQIAIGWLIVEDLVMVLTLVLLPAVAGMMEQGDVGFATLAVDMGITIGKVIAFIAIMMLVGRRLVPWIMARSAATGSRELLTLSVLALALGVAFGAVELFDVSFALGAFFAGMVLNESELSHRAAHDTLPLRDAFAVLFFVSVGMLFDPLILIQQPLAVMVLNESELSHRAAHDTLPLRDAFAVLFFVSVGMLFDPLILIQQPLAVLATLAIILFGKSLAAFFLVRLFGHSQRTALTIAASLAQIGEFAFILAGLGMALNLLPQAGQNLVLAGAILSIMLNPVLFALLEKYLAKTETLEEQTGMALNLLPQAGQNLVLAGAILSIMLNPVLFALLEKYLAKTETLEEQTLEEAIEEEKQIPVDICNHALLVGYGRVGSLLGEKLLASDIPLVVIETSRTRVDELRERGVRAVLGNAANEEIMQLAHLECAKWLILTIPNGYEAGEIVASARAKNPDIEIIARAHYDDEVTYITERGANQVVMGEREIARTMLEVASARAKNPDIEIIARAHYDDEVTYITERGANQVVMGEREIARTMLELLETPPAGEVVTG